MSASRGDLAPTQAKPKCRAEGSLCDVSHTNLKNARNVFSKLSFKKCKFFTIRDNAHTLNMNKVHKYFKKFCRYFIIVKSPQNGEHYHALAETQGPIPYFRKATNFHVLQVGGTKDPHCYEAPHQPPRERHAYIPGEVGERLLMVCAAIRARFGGRKTPYAAVLKSRASTIVRKTKKRKEIDRIIDYLEKNLYENDSPIYYDHLIIKIN